MTVFIHSTSSLLAILESGYFKGSDKAAAKTGGMGQNPMTLFIEWGVGDIRQSISRMRPSRTSQRGVLAFMNKAGVPDDEKIAVPANGGYPRVLGAEVKLSSLSLRAVVAAEEDCGEDAYGAILTLTKNYRGSPFGVYLKKFDDAVTVFNIDKVLLEAQLHGCFH